MLVQLNCNENNVLKNSNIVVNNTQSTVDPLNQFFQLSDSILNTRLCKGIVILNTIQKLWQTPERVCFNTIAILIGQLAYIMRI